MITRHNPPWFFFLRVCQRCCLQHQGGKPAGSSFSDHSCMRTGGRKHAEPNMARTRVLCSCPACDKWSSHWSVSMVCTKPYEFLYDINQRVLLYHLWFQICKQPKLSGCFWNTLYSTFILLINATVSVYAYIGIVSCSYRTISKHNLSSNEKIHWRKAK